MPKATHQHSTSRRPSSEFLTEVNRLQLSLMIRDPFVRHAFERAERDGLAPMAMGIDRPRAFNGGAAAALEECV